MFWNFEFKWMSNLELCNEAIILMTTYFTFLYSDGLLLTAHPSVDFMVKDTNLALKVAWAHVGFIGLILGVNLIAMIVI